MPPGRGAPCGARQTRKAAQHDRGELDEVVSSDAFSQDCTAALRTIKDKKKGPKTGKTTISVVVAGSREWNLEGFSTFGEPSTDFNFRHFLDEKDVKKAKGADAAQAREETGQNIKKPKKSDKIDTDRLSKLVDGLTST